MANEKKAFLLYNNMASVFSALEDEQAGALIKAIVEYVNTGEEPLMEPTMMALFLMFRTQIDDAQVKWEETKEKRRLAIQTRWQREKENKCIQMNTSVNTSTVCNTNDTVNVNVNGNVNVNKEKGISKDIPKKKEAKPTFEEVVAYFQERNSTEAEAQKYFDHYTANGWKVGKNPMKDWKAAARNWLNSEYRTPAYTAPVDKAKALGKVVDRTEHSGHDILQRNRPLRLKQAE